MWCFKHSCSMTIISFINDASWIILYVHGAAIIFALHCLETFDLRNFEATSNHGAPKDQHLWPIQVENKSCKCRHHWQCVQTGLLANQASTRSCCRRCISCSVVQRKLPCKCQLNEHDLAMPCNHATLYQDISDPCINQINTVEISFFPQLAMQNLWYVSFLQAHLMTLQSYSLYSSLHVPFLKAAVSDQMEGLAGSTVKKTHNTHMKSKEMLQLDQAWTGWAGLCRKELKSWCIGTWRCGS